jgi:hypothetical protein
MKKALALLVPSVVLLGGALACSSGSNSASAPSGTRGAAGVETDLSAFGPEFAGYVAMAPKGTKVEFDDPSRHLTVSDSDYLSIGEAPGYDDAMKGLADDKDNSNIKRVSATEVRWERNPPLGKEWNFDVKLAGIDGDWDCSGSTFTSAAMADSLVEICKSIRKK